MLDYSKACSTEQPYQECARHHDDDGLVADWLCVQCVGPVLDLPELEGLMGISMRSVSAELPPHLKFCDNGLSPDLAICLI